MILFKKVIFYQKLKKILLIDCTLLILKGSSKLKKRQKQKQKFQISSTKNISQRLVKQLVGKQYSMMNMNQFEIFPQRNISRHLLKHQEEMLMFLYFTQYDIILQSFELKHAAYISSTKRGYPVQQFNKSEEIQRHFGMISQKLHMRFMRQDMALDRMLEGLEVFWQNRNVPLFHRYYFQKYMHSAHIKGVVELMQKQQKLVRQQKHYFYIITKTIKAREACLRQLKRQVADLKVQDFQEYFFIGKERWSNEKSKNQHYSLQQKGYTLKNATSEKPAFKQTISPKCKLQFFSDTFGHLTKLTLYCVQEIINWKNYIYNLTHDVKKKRQRLEYFYFEENYLLKMLSDTTFLNVSLLGQYLQFPPKNDPFQLYPIISIENSPNKNLHTELLKQIFMPLSQNLPEILNKIQTLSVQYKWNIKSRKNYDINLLKIPSMTQQSQLGKSNVKIHSSNKQTNNPKQAKHLMDNGQLQGKQPISNMVLKKIQQSPKRTKSLKIFRIRQQTKNKNLVQSVSKDKILIEFKTSPKKKANWLPGITLKTVKQTQISPLKNSVILQRNKINPLAHQQINDDLLKSLKQEVIRKIKLDYQVNNGNKDSASKDQALEIYISSKINQAIKGIFPYEPQKNLKPPIQLTSIRINEQNLNQQVSLIVKDSHLLYKGMQYQQTQLLKQLSQVPFVYFLKATEGQKYIGTVIATLDDQVKQYKTLKKLFVGFNDVNDLEMLIIQTTKFLQKYQNAFEVHFPFFLPVNNDPIRQLLLNLQKKLTNLQEKSNLKCVVAQKQIYSNVSETRFMFRRKEQNVDFYPNPFPISLHFKISLIHSEKKLFLQRSKVQKSYGNKVCYDLLMSDVLRKKYDGQKMRILKQKSFSQVRFNEMIKMMQQRDQAQTQINGKKGGYEQNIMRYVESSSISELNKQQAKDKQSHPYMELSDTLKTGNQIQYVSIQKIYKLPYGDIKAILGKNNEMMYRIIINEQIPVQVYQNTLFYKLTLGENAKNGETQQKNSIDKAKTLKQNIQNSKQTKLILFSAKQFLQSEKSDLTTYLIEALLNNSQKQKQVLVKQLWIPMIRYPQTYSKKQQLFMATHPINDFKQIKTHLFVAQFIEWFCHLPILSGINYQLPSFQHKKAQIQFKKPFGFAILSYLHSKPIISYARVLADN